MKGSALAVVVLLASTLPLFAEPEPMTAEQLQQFNRQRLTVEVAITTSVSGGFGAFSMESHRRWTGRKGFERLSEAEFYNIAGYPDESVQAAKYRNTALGLLVGGGALVAGGLAWSLLGVSDLAYDDPNYLTRMNRRLYGGLALTMGGTIPFVIGSSRIRKNWSSADQAQMVAEEYNTKLEEKIRRR